MNSKAAAGLAYRHVWLPSALPAAAPAPEMTLKLPSGDITVTMTKVRADAGVTLTDGIQLLTFGVDVGTSARGLTGTEGGTSWLDLEQFGRFPVRIGRFETNKTALLSVPLPHDVPPSAAGSLIWNIWEAQFSSAQIGAVTLKRNRWFIEYTEDLGPDRTGGTKRIGGLLDIVHNPFDTGLTDDDVYAVAAPLINQIPSSQRGFAPQRASALDVLVNRIRRGLPSGSTEDDVSGAQFKDAHALLTASTILRGHGAQGYDRNDDDYLTEANILISAALANLDWLDSNEDGEVDDGETGVTPGASYTAITPRSHMNPSAGSKPTVWPPVNLRRIDINEAK